MTNSEGICGFNSCWVILTLLQTGSVYHLIWFPVSKFCLGKSYTQHTQEGTMPTSEEGLCEILFSETFLSLNWQACLQLRNCGLLWQFTMRTVSESDSPVKRAIKTHCIWFSPSFLRMRPLFHTHTQSVFYFMKLDLSYPPESGLENHYHGFRGS